MMMEWIGGSACTGTGGQLISGVSPLVHPHFYHDHLNDNHDHHHDDHGDHHGDENYDHDDKLLAMYSFCRLGTDCKPSVVRILFLLDIFSNALIFFR